MNGTALQEVVAPGDTPGVVEVDGDRITLREVVVTDPALAGLLAPLSPPARVDKVLRALAVGTQGLLDMGLGIDVAEVDRVVQGAVLAATERAAALTEQLLDTAQQALAAQLDPDLRSGMMGRALDDFARQRERLLAGLDPAAADSKGAALVARFTELVGRGGVVERILSEALDPKDDRSPIGSLRADMQRQFGELRELLARSEGKSLEAARGTAKGVDFEDAVEGRLRALAAGIGGCTVERTSRIAGTLGAESFVGDFVIEFRDGTRITVEAKNSSRISVAGSSGMLAELDRAMANRNAHAAVCISARPDAFPAEVGAFGVFDHKVLVADDGSGHLLAAAVRLLAAQVSSPAAAANIDAAALGDGLARIQRLSQRLSDQRRALTEVSKGVLGVRDALGELRQELVDQVEELLRRLAAPGA